MNCFSRIDLSQEITIRGQRLKAISTLRLALAQLRERQDDSNGLRHGDSAITAYNVNFACEMLAAVLQNIELQETTIDGCDVTVPEVTA